RRKLAGEPVADLLARVRGFLAGQLGDVGDEGTRVAVDLLELGLVGVGPFVEDRLEEGGPVLLDVVPFHGQTLRIGGRLSQCAHEGTDAKGGGSAKSSRHSRGGRRGGADFRRPPARQGPRMRSEPALYGAGAG